MGTPGELAVILAETDVLIDFLVDFQPIKNQIADYIKAEPIQTTAATCFELLSDADESKRGHAVHQLLDALSVLPFDRAAAIRAAEVRRSSTGPARQSALRPGIGQDSRIRFLKRSGLHRDCHGAERDIDR
jgi:predicted nucleic acid-binding protein